MMLLTYYHADMVVIIPTITITKHDDGLGFAIDFLWWAAELII